MLYIFTGEGKGKTTAAIGTIVRAHGAGKTCAIVFFDKNPAYCNELTVLRLLGIEAHIFGINRLDNKHFRLGCDEKDMAEAKNALNKAKKIIDKSEVLILDEFLNAVRTGQVRLQDALTFIDAYPKEKYLILTGRGLPEEIKVRAELISEIKKIKHPFDSGAPAEKGIDF